MTTTGLTFTVIGTPQPAGSKKGFVINGKAVLSDANKKSKPWKQEVASVASQAFLATGRALLLTGPIRATFCFYRPRLTSHFGKSGVLNKSGRDTPYPITKPDALKLARGVEDALTKVVYHDDSQIVEEHLYKLWGEPARVEVTIEEMRETIWTTDPAGQPQLDALLKAVGWDLKS